MTRIATRALAAIGGIAIACVRAGYAWLWYRGRKRDTGATVSPDARTAFLAGCDATLALIQRRIAVKIMLAGIDDTLDAGATITRAVLDSLHAEE